MFNLLAIPSVIALGGLNVALVDLVVLAILLIALIVGLCKGFVRQIFIFMGWVAAIVIAIFTCKIVAEFLSDTFPAITNAISSGIDGALSSAGIPLEGSKEQIMGALSTSSIPAFLHSLLADVIVKSTAELNLTQTITGWAMVGISFVAVFIVSLILLAILKKIFRVITKGGVFGAIDRILGMIFSIAVTLVILLVVFIILSLVIKGNINEFLLPVTESGEAVKCYFNELLTKIMELPFIKNLIPA